MFCLRTLYLPSFFFFSKLRSITREVHLLIWKRIVLFLERKSYMNKIASSADDADFFVEDDMSTMTGDGDDSLSRRRVRDCRLREPLSYIDPLWWMWWWWRWQWGLAMIELAEEGVDVQRAAASFYFPSPLPPPTFLHSDCTVQRVATEQFFHWTASSIEIAMFTVHTPRYHWIVWQWSALIWAGWRRLPPISSLPPHYPFAHLQHHSHW